MYLTLLLQLGAMYMYKVTAGAWCTLSFLVVAGSILAFFMPYWLVAKNDGPFTIEVSVFVIL